MGPWKLKQNSRGPGISPEKTPTRVGISHTSSIPRLNYNYTWGMLRNQNTVKYSKVLVRFFLIFKHCIWFSFRGDICQCKNHWHHEKGQGVFKDFFLKRRCLIQFFDPVYFYYSNSEGSHRSWGKLFVCKSSGFNHLSSMTSFTSLSQTPLSFRNIIVALKNPQNTVASDHSNHYVNFARVVKFSIKTCMVRPSV